MMPFFQRESGRSASFHANCQIPVTAAITTPPTAIIPNRLNVFQATAISRAGSPPRRILQAVGTAIGAIKNSNTQTAMPRVILRPLGFVMRAAKVNRKLGDALGDRQRDLPREAGSISSRIGLAPARFPADSLIQIGGPLLPAGKQPA